MSIEAMKQALEALDMVTVDAKTTPNSYEASRQAITALRAAIEQEPVTWWNEPGAQMNYRKWKGLTDEEREQFRQWAHPDIIEAIELKLQERNA